MLEELEGWLNVSEQQGGERLGTVPQTMLKSLSFTVHAVQFIEGC